MPQSDSYFGYYVFHEVTFVIFVLISIITDSLIAFIFLRRSELRTTAHIFLANWAIADILSLIFTPSAYNVLSIIERWSPTYGFNVAVSKLGFLFHSAVIFFVTIIAIDWFFAAYFSNLSEKIRKYYLYILGTVWGLVFILGVLTFTGCRDIRNCTIYGPELLVSFLVLLVILVLIQIVRAVQKCRGRSSPYSGISINLVTTFVIVWSASLMNFIHGGWYMIHPVLAIFTNCAMFSSGLICFMLLCKWNEQFFEALEKIFCRKRVRHLEFKNPIVINQQINTDVIAA